MAVEKTPEPSRALKLIAAVHPRRAARGDDVEKTPEPSRALKPSCCRPRRPLLRGGVEKTPEPSRALKLSGEASSPRYLDS